MGFRFRRRIKIAPGIRLNLSKSGVSTSLGGRGFTVNLGRGKTRTTVGLPGTGMSYTSTAPTGASGQRSSALTWLLVFGIVVVAITLFLASCAATYSQPTLIAPDTSQSIPGSQSVLLRLAQRVLVSEGLQITNADETAGVISTEPKEITLTPDLADCGTLLGSDFLAGHSQLARVGYGVIVSDNKLTVTLNMSEPYLPVGMLNSVAVTCVSKGVLEAHMLTKIAGAAKR